MATHIAVFVNQMETLLAMDASELVDIVDREEIVKTAVERYSHDAPEKITADISGDGGKYYAISGLTSWIEGFSQVLAIQYPARDVTADEVPQMLKPEDWDDNYRDGDDTQYIFLPNHAPASSEEFRVTYTTTYQLASNAYSTPAGDFFAICNLAAHFACLALAAKYARTNDSLISADSVDHGGRSERFRSLARDFERAYLEHMDMTGDDASKEKPAGEFVDWDTFPAFNRRYLFHGNR